MAKNTHTQPWNTTDIPDQPGRTAVVTGANSGLGLATALAAAGTHVVLAVRDTERGEAAAATVNGSVEVRRLDLADLASVREFAADWHADLDLLINNASVMNRPCGVPVVGRAQVPGQSPHPLRQPRSDRRVRPVDRLEDC